MDEVTSLLHAFGFTARDAHKIARQVEKNGLSLEDVKAWVDEANNSTSLLNPLGFVRARLQDGDKAPARVPLERRHLDRHRYLTQWNVRRSHQSLSTAMITQTGTCGHVCWKDRICADCGQCPTCCTCASTDIDKE